MAWLVVARSIEREGFRVAGSGEPKERRLFILAEGVVRRGRYLCGRAGGGAFGT